MTVVGPDFGAATVVINGANSPTPPPCISAARQRRASRAFQLADQRRRAGRIGHRERHGRHSSGTSAVSSFDQYNYATSVTFTVENANATGTGSLAAAVANADAANIPVTINFDPAVFTSATTITLSNVLTLSTNPEPITINGAAPGPITIDGNGGGAFSVSPGVIANIENLTVTGCAYNGWAAISAYWATLSLTNCTITNNNDGAINSGLLTTAIPYSGGSLTVADCTITDNSGPYGCIETNGVATFENCTITGNSPSGNYGPTLIMVAAGTSLMIMNTAIINNPEAAADLDIDGGEVAVVENSTFSDVQAGVGISGASATLVNCNISGNSRPLDHQRRNGNGC